VDRYQPKQRKVRYQLEPDLNEREERVTGLFTDLVRRVRERQEAERRLQTNAEIVLANDLRQPVMS